MQPYTNWIRNASDEEAVRKGCYFDLDAALRVREFFTTFLKHPKGRNADKPFELLPWQWEGIIAPAFGWKMPNGKRRFQNVEIWIPKKNGKSTLMAGVALYLLCGDGEPSPHVYSAACDREQAGIVYKEAVSMVRRSPDLEEILKVRESKKLIRFPEIDGEYKVLSADGYRNEGLNIHGLLFDELHTQPNRDLWKALRYGGAARDQPICFVLSTAGELDESLLWWERFSHARRIQKSEVIDIYTLPCVYAMEDYEDWEDENVWKRVNPSWGASLNEVEFRKAYQEALKNPADKSDFLRYRLNKPTKHESTWLEVKYWNGCTMQPTEDEPVLAKDPMRFIAVDLSNHLDLSATADIRKVSFQGQERIQAKFSFWAPSEPANKINKDRYQLWADMGLLKLIPGPVARQEVVEDDIIASLIDDPVPVTGIGVDKFNATRFVYSMQTKLKELQLWKKDILRLVGYNGPNLHEPLKCLEDLIIGGILLHDANPIMEWMLTNCMTTTDSNGNRKLDKKASKGKIDGFAALLMSVYMAINQEPTFKSKYSDRRPLTLAI